MIVGNVDKYLTKITGVDMQINTFPRLVGKKRLVRYEEKYFTKISKI